MLFLRNLRRRRGQSSLYLAVAELAFAIWLWYINLVKLEGIVRTVRTSAGSRDPYRAPIESSLRSFEAPLANVTIVPAGLVGTVVHQPSRRRRPQLMKPLSSQAIEDARKKVLKYLNTSTTFRIFHRDVIAENFKFGTNLSTILQHNQTDALPSPVGHRCAVIGNSGILRFSLCGHEIDDHDFVFRLNLAPVDGEFTRDVGTKIDLITLNRMELIRLSKLSDSLKSKEEGWMFIERLSSVTNQSIIWYPKGFPEKLSKIAASFRDVLRLQPAWAYSPESLMYLASRVWKMPVPSTGLSVMTSALLHCDEVTMYGFYPFPRDSHGRALRYHYYEPDTKPFYTKGNDTIGVHKMPKEFALLQKLAKDGALRLVTERCYDESLDIS